MPVVSILEPRAFIRLAFFLGFALVFSSVAEVPRALFYQGRLLDHESLKALPGTITNQKFRVLIHKLSAPGATPLLDRTVEGITVTNGLFTLAIDTSSASGTPPLTFDEPYMVEVVLGGTSGGRIGQQVFSSVPFAFGAENALNLNALGASAYATQGHNLETPGGASFTIDGSAQTRANQDQLVISNDSSGSAKTIFSLDESGHLKSIRNIQATSEVLSLAGFDITRINASGDSVSVMQITSFGDFTVKDSEFPGQLSVGGGLRVTSSLNGFSTSSSFEFQGDVLLGSVLEFEVGSGIQFQGSLNPVGASHQVEDHARGTASLMQSRLETLVSNKVVDSSFHVHRFENGEISQFNDETLDGGLIKDGSLKDSDFQFADLASLILDTKLATIATTGKVDLSALPSEVALTDANNDFTFSFPQTLNEFDQMKSKAISVISTLDERISGAFPLLRLLDNIPVGSGTNLFEMSILSSGDLHWSKGISGSATSGFILSSPGNKSKTFFNGTNLQIEDISGATGLSFFDSNMIEDGSITAADFGDQAFTESKFGDFDAQNSTSGVGTTNFSTQAVGTADLSGGLTSRVFSDLGSSSGAAVTSLELQNNTLLTADFADGAITMAKMLDAAFNNTSFFATGFLTSGKIEDGAITNQKLHDNSSDLLLGDDFASLSITASKISTVFADRVDPSKISVEVLESRTLPMQISTSASVILTLKNVNSQSGVGMTYLRMELVNFSPVTDFSPAVEVQDKDADRLVGLNTNGTISLSFSTGSLVPVTLEPQLMATLFGVSDKDGNCGQGDQKMRALVGDSVDYRYDCISKSINHGGPALSYFDAEQVCNSDGYQLCDANQYLRSCASGYLTTGEHLLSQGLAGVSTAVTFDVLDGANNCSDDASDYGFTSVASTSAATGFRCCLK